MSQQEQAPMWPPQTPIEKAPKPSRKERYKTRSDRYQPWRPGQKQKMTLGNSG